jgi:hypothetical protein
MTVAVRAVGSELVATFYLAKPLLATGSNVRFRPIADIP